MLRLFIIMILCIIPSIIVLYYIYQKDKIEKEPIHLLALLFVEGIVCAIIAFIIPKILIQYVPAYKSLFYPNTVFGNMFKDLILIAAFEEVIKWIINYSTILKSKNFNHVYDSIVYSTFISIGFATYDCVVYGIENSNFSYSDIMLNILTDIPTYAVLGIFMGYYLSIAKKASICNDKKNANIYRFYSLVIPIIFHFIYNLCFDKRHIYTFIMLIIYIVILYVEAIKNVNELSKVETMLIDINPKDNIKQVDDKIENDTKDEEKTEINTFDLPKMKDNNEKKE